MVFLTNTYADTIVYVFSSNTCDLSFAYRAFPAYNGEVVTPDLISVGISEDTGYRSSMEDEHAVYRRPDLQFFSAEVYDGHGGRKAAQVAAEMITPHVLHALSLEAKKPLRDQLSLSRLVKDAYKAVDIHLTQGRVESGTTAAGLYLRGDRFLAVNCGDTKIVMGTDEGVSELTADHKPDVPEELERIEQLGGYVISFGVARVMGVLAVSRALGDYSLKPFVTAEPRIVEGLLGRENDYAVIACDGVWDVLTPDVVIAMTRAVQDAQTAAENIKTTAIESGSTDNVTVIVLDLRTYVASLKRRKMETVRIIDTALEQL